MQDGNNHKTDKWENFKLILGFIGFLILCFLFVNELFERVNFINLFMKLLWYLIGFRLLGADNIIGKLLGMLFIFGTYHMP